MIRLINTNAAPMTVKIVIDRSSSMPIRVGFLGTKASIIPAVDSRCTLLNSCTLCAQRETAGLAAPRVNERRLFYFKLYNQNLCPHFRAQANVQYLSA
jgi:hypothetical protein